MPEASAEAAPARTPARRDLEQMLDHHQLSGLDPSRAGAMPERLHRRSQPNPFRRYAGAARLDLPLLGAAPGDLGSGDGDDGGDGDEAPRAASLSLETVGRLLEDSLALAGWKRKENAAFGLRVTPSAGNLHPLETYVLAPGLEEESGGQVSGEDEANAVAALYHYSPFDHALERRRRLPAAVWQSLRAACPGASMFIALSAIYWRCAWKYGERAFRLTQLDAGHAAAALDAAAALGGQCVRWVDSSDDDLQRLLGLGAVEDPEEEDPLCLLALEPRGESAPAGRWRPEAAVLDALAATRPTGEPSRISERHRRWPGLVAAARASRRRVDAAPVAVVLSERPATWGREVLRRRRSRSTYDDRSLGRGALARLIDPLVGETAASSFPRRQDLAVLLFVHRVDGVEPGLYAALPPTAEDRNAQGYAELRAAMRAEFEWRELAVEAGRWRLVCLSRGDARRAVTHLSGGQPAAGDGAFTALFLGDFKALRHGAWHYRRLHWQAGELGHRLYLAAEAENLGATGLGGFYDDRLRALLGLDETEDSDWRPLYELAVGHRLGEDPALESPYAHRGTGAEPVPASRGGFASGA